MNTSRTHFPAKSLLVLAISSALVACGGSSSSKKDEHDHEHEHEHEHDDHAGRLLFSVQDNDPLFVYDEAENKFDDIGSATANAATLVLADNGLSAAVLAGTTLNIVFSGLHNDDHNEEHDHDEEHDHAELLDITLNSVTKVIATRGHFSALSNGATQLLNSDDIENPMLAFETAITTPASQTYPGIVLDAEHRVFFAADNAYVYNDMDLEDTLDCTNPTHHAEAGELTVINCDGTAKYVVLEVHGDHHHIYTGEVAGLSAINLTNLTSNGHDIVAWTSSNAWIIAINEHDDSHTHDMVSIQAANESLTVEASALTLPELNGASICQAAFATEDKDTLGVLTSNGRLHLINVEDDTNRTLTLDNTNTDCNSLHLAAGAEAFLVANTVESKLYLIDAHDGPYHIHSRINDSRISELAHMVYMHASHDDHDDHDHDHDNHDDHSSHSH